ncbi:hypothetical protein E4U42_001482 [Claviceps africana]|uniref:Uncharacterized protein n=1 Tax=Claviceps africana TaxID=83212 RepID=A0A8K0NHA9_9HYPO|nr:hypothetical protein E4U42_001482 [Claviceps africana]
MQFSTSAVLAAVAIFAGQAYAKCGVPMPNKGRPLGAPCTYADGPDAADFLACGQSNALFRSTGAWPSFKITSGDQLITIIATCPDDGKTAQLTCEPHSEGTVDLPCRHPVTAESIEYS